MTKRNGTMRTTKGTARSLGRSSLRVVAFGTVAMCSLALAPWASAEQAGTSRVIVSMVDSTQAHQRVTGIGAKVRGDLGDAGAVVADVSPAQQAILAADPNVQVSPDSVVSITAAPASAPTRAPAAVFPQVTGADRLVSKGVNGYGVGVAVIDTGIAPLPDFAGRLIGGVDLSGEGNPFKDSYGHGTFVGGLIAGNGYSSAGAYVGEAPAANLVAVKVAGASGTTDVATVIQGIQWAVANQHTYGIGVINLSLGAVPTQPAALDPLDRAVETAWNHGIVVVVSAGNSGPRNGTVTTPGNDPLVITVGALDDKGTVTREDDAMTSFSSVGPTMDGIFKPDLVASGRSVISLRAPGSAVDAANPSARIGTGNFVGSGTSFSAAITSGAAALLLQADPHARPDRVKAQLLAGAARGPAANPFVDGHGSLNVLAAASAKGLSLKQDASLPKVATDGSVSLADGWKLSSWNPDSWSGASWDGASWNGASWNGASWDGASWNGASWNGASWNGASWNGASWNGAPWNGASWNGASWNGASWN